MISTQLQSGLCFSHLRELLCGKNGDKTATIDGLLKHLSYYSLFTDASDFSIDSHEIDPIVAVANNIIVRGLPTLPSNFIEDSFIEAFGRTKKEINKVKAIEYKFSNINKDFLGLCFRALHIIEPRTTKFRKEFVYKKSWEKLGSNYEENFLFRMVPGLFGEEIMQLLETQRDLENILRFSINRDEELDKYINGSVDLFFGQKTDFTIEPPYSSGNKQGLVIEIDGVQHEELGQKHIDGLRDEAIKRAGWHNTLRIKTGEFDNIENKLQPLKELINEKDGFFELIKKNYQEPLYKSKEGLEALCFILTPFAIARIQKCIIEALRVGVLNFKQKEWNICVIERDVPGAYLAIQDLQKLFSHLFNLEGQGKIFPQIKLAIYNTDEFAQIHEKIKGKTKLIDNIHAGLKCDILIDVSVLQRDCFTYQPEKIKTGCQFIIRSSQSIQLKRKFYTSELIKYKPLLGKKSEDANRVKSTEYFLQNIFRKNEFKDGQKKILNRSLQLKDVIGLLPTGGGKSLTYQLSALLQPGVVIVVDPIKSLMKDQNDNLIKMYIDGTVFINSSIRIPREKRLAADKLIEAEVMFAFISPERLLIKEFRDKLGEMPQKNNYFSYCVIDEAHCVSEWGHDFRTSYLKLADNAKKYCLTKNSNPVSIFGLTATASFDVLEDVQRELHIDPKSDPEVIVYAESLERKELELEVEDIKVSEDIKNINTTNDSKGAGLVRGVVDTAKKNYLHDLLEKIPEKLQKLNEDTSRKDCHLDNVDFNNFYTPENAGLIFCPWKNYQFGVNGVSDLVRREYSKTGVGTFKGSSDDDEGVNEELVETNERNQDNFINNRLGILVATKAFGMGIDKPNVRFSVHFNYPGSIESYYQEAGRAGRDQCNALSFILYAGTAVEKEVHEFFHRNSFKGPEKEKRLLYELLDEITFPPKTERDNLAENILNDLGEEVDIRLWLKDNLRRLYINKAFNQGYGYLDLRDNNLNIELGNLGADVCRHVMDIAKNYLKGKIQPGKSVLDIIQEEMGEKTIPGIECQLEKIAVGEEFNTIVGFRNNGIEEVTKFLQRKVDSQFTAIMAKEASRYSFDLGRFIDSLKKEYEDLVGEKIDIEGKLDDNNRSKLNQLFLQIRDEIDTFKAIYRLSLIGVIDDYEIDYGKKTIFISGKKKGDDEYIGCLEHYTSKYVGIEQVRLVRKDVQGHRGDSIIQKCAGYLIEFIYEHIAKKRAEAIDKMVYACDLGLAQGNAAFKEYVNDYLSAGYTREMREDAHGGNYYDANLIFKYIEITKGNIDKLKHLRASCDRLLTDYTENAAFRIISAFTRFILDKDNEELLKRAESDLKKGLELFQKDKNIGAVEYFNLIEKFKNWLLKYDNDLRSIFKEIETKIALTYYGDWLKEFNNKFLKNYGQRRN